MKSVLIGIASFIALSAALPTVASDITSDRYAPSREERLRARATPAATATTATATNVGQAIETKQGPCSCDRKAKEDRPVMSRPEPGRH